MKNPFKKINNYATGRVFYKNASDLEAESQSLSSYTGGSPVGYIGQGDPFISNVTGDSGSFADATHKGKLYTITLINANANTRIALLCPGLLFNNAVGLMTDGAFNDAGGNAGLSGTGAPLALVYFNAFIHNYPTICAGLRISTTNIVQFDQVFTLFKQSPFSQEASRIINPGAYVDPINPNTNLVVIPETFYMDSQTVIQYPVLGSTAVSLMLFFGASLNIANALYNKAEIAEGNLTRLGLTPATGVSNYRGR